MKSIFCIVFSFLLLSAEIAESAKSLDHNMYLNQLRGLNQALLPSSSAINISRTVIDKKELSNFSKRSNLGLYSEHDVATLAQYFIVSLQRNNRYNRYIRETGDPFILLTIEEQFKRYKDLRGVTFNPDGLMVDAFCFCLSKSEKNAPEHLSRLLSLSSEEVRASFVDVGAVSLAVFEGKSVSKDSFLMLEEEGCFLVYYFVSSAYFPSPISNLKTLIIDQLSFLLDQIASSDTYLVRY